MEFKPFPKIARLSREIIITEKLDGTNAAVVVAEDGTVTAQSRSRVITPQDDNYGFAGWAEKNAAALRELGPGYHFGEWWGLGIQRGYGLTERRFSLFNVSRWGEQRPACCDVVVELYRGLFDSEVIGTVLYDLQQHGSRAAPGFMKPEGIIVFHTHARMMFKETIEKDEMPKTAVLEAA